MAQNPEARYHVAHGVVEDLGSVRFTHKVLRRDVKLATEGDRSVTAHFLGEKAVRTVSAAVRPGEDLTVVGRQNPRGDIFVHYR